MNVYRIIYIVSLLMWAGSVLSISFMEAPLKFTAPDITVELGLGIGKIVFHALNKIEWVFAIAVIVSMLFLRPAKKVLIFFFISWTILIYQTFLLLPQLDVRAEAVLAGEPLPPSSHHITYIIVEAVKVVSLVITAVLFINLNLKTYDTSGNSGTP